MIDGFAALNAAWDSEQVFEALRSELPSFGVPTADIELLELRYGWLKEKREANEKLSALSLPNLSIQLRQMLLTGETSLEEAHLSTIIQIIFTAVAALDVVNMIAGAGILRMQVKQRDLPHLASTLSLLDTLCEAICLPQANDETAWLRRLSDQR